MSYHKSDLRLLAVMPVFHGLIQHNVPFQLSKSSCERVREQKCCEELNQMKDDNTNAAAARDTKGVKWPESSSYMNGSNPLRMPETFLFAFSFSSIFLSKKRLSSGA